MEFLPEGGSFSEIILENLEGGYPCHPLPFILKGVETYIEKILESAFYLESTTSIDSNAILDTVEYVPTPLEETYQRDQRVLKADLTARLLLLSVFDTSVVQEQTKPYLDEVGGQTNFTSPVEGEDDQDFCDAGF
jgi:hypothetical protein